MKFLFLTPSELESVLCEIFSQEMSVPVECKTGFDETAQADMVTITSGSGEKNIMISELFGRLESRYQVRITKFDVYEFGDFGEGFAFFIE